MKQNKDPTSRVRPTIDSTSFIENVACAVFSANITSSNPLRINSEVAEDSFDGKAVYKFKASFRARYADMDGRPKTGAEYISQYLCDRADGDSDISLDEFRNNNLKDLAGRIQSLDPKLYQLSDRLRASLINKGLFVYPSF